MSPTRTRIVVAALALTGCSGNTSSNARADGGEDGGSATSDADASGPCGPLGLYGTFRVQGILLRAETLCGLPLGSFESGTLTITQSGSSGAWVTLSHSENAHMDVTNCEATVEGCTVSTSTCPGSVDAISVKLTMTATETTLLGQSRLGVNGCQAPGLSFTGTR